VRRTAGFTLIEMLAVVAIFALMAAIVMPNLGFVSRRALRNDAERLAARLELARQRSVVTGVPHRLVLDLDQGGWQLEWLSGAEGAPPEEPPDQPLDPSADAPLALDAPPAETLSYGPLQGPLGSFTPLDDDVAIHGVETPEGWIEQGQAFVEFDRDGTTTWTSIVLGNEDGDELELELLPLADVVRIQDAKD
jgi:prepilin-type N-terminal cleavage/methylation domain-containing protein